MKLMAVVWMLLGILAVVFIALGLLRWIMIRGRQLRGFRGEKKPTDTRDLWFLNPPPKKRLPDDRPAEDD